MKKSIRKREKCSKCSKRLRRVKYECLSCEKYLLCSECYKENKKVRFHLSGHNFFEYHLKVVKKVKNNFVNPDSPMRSSSLIGKCSICSATKKDVSSLYKCSKEANHFLCGSCYKNKKNRLSLKVHGVVCKFTCVYKARVKVRKKEPMLEQKVELSTNFPLDCFSYLLQFIYTPQVFFNVCLISKRIREYVLNNLFCSKNVHFEIFKNPERKISYVQNLEFKKNELSSKVTIKRPFLNCFINIKKLVLNKRDIYCKDLFFCENIEELHIVNDGIFHGLKIQLKSFESLNKLKKLTIKCKSRITLFEKSDKIAFDASKLKVPKTLKEINLIGIEGFIFDEFGNKSIFSFPTFQRLSKL